jgi:hypothetical protein
MHRNTLSMVVGLSLTAALVVGGGGSDEGRDADPPVVLPEAPTQEQADADAREEISEQNADAAFDQLSREVESDLSGDG